MHGKDIERLINILTAIKKTTSLNIHKLGRMSDPRLIMIKHTHNVFVNNEAPNAPHGHPSGAHIHNFWLQGNLPTKGRGYRDKISTQLTWPEDYKEDEHYQHLHDWDSDVLEKEHPVKAHDYTNPIRDLRIHYLTPENKKMEKIEVDNYEQVMSFNTEAGSPWDEMYDLEEKIEEMEAYADDYPNLQWLGEKHTLLALMHVVLTYCIDAKWALIHFQDYIQRGYDYQFNDGIPSVRWSDFEKEPEPPLEHAPGSPEDFREGRTDGNKLEIQPTIGVKVNVGALASFFGGMDPFGMVKNALGDLASKIPNEILSGLQGAIGSSLSNIPGSLSGGIGRVTDNFVKNLTDNVSNGINDIANKVSGEISGKISGALNGKTPSDIAGSVAKNMTGKIPGKPSTKLPTKLPF